MHPTWRSEELCTMLGKKCETLYRSFIWAPVGTDSDRAVSSLLSRLGQKKQERWEEAINSIDFSHSSRKVWRTIKKLTGGLDAHFACALSWQSPSPRNSWKMGHTGPEAASPPGSSTRSCKKTVSATFHLNNKEAKLEFKVKYNNEILPFCCEPKYVGVTLDRLLTYRRHLESFARSWHHASRSWGSLLAPVGVLEQQLCK